MTDSVYHLVLLVANLGHDLCPTLKVPLSSDIAVCLKALSSMLAT